MKAKGEFFWMILCVMEVRAHSLTVQENKALPYLSLTVHTVKMLGCHVNVSSLVSPLPPNDLLHVCLASCTDGLVRLLVSEDSNTFYMGLADYDAAYYDKGGLRVGRVEVCYDGKYGAVCEDEWEDKEASVVCRQLGFSPYGNWDITCYTHIQVI